MNLKSITSNRYNFVGQKKARLILQSGIYNLFIYSEGLPRVLWNKGKISKGEREHEPIFREQGNKTVQIRGRKNFDIGNKERYF